MGKKKTCLWWLPVVSLLLSIPALAMTAAPTKTVGASANMLKMEEARFIAEGGAALPANAPATDERAPALQDGVFHVEINPVNNLNPMYPTLGGERLRDQNRVRTENTFLRPGERVKYNATVTPEEGDAPAPVWSLSGGAPDTTLSDDGLLSVSESQPAGDLFITATVGDASATAKVTVRIVTDAHGYDQRAKWATEPFPLSEVSLDEDGLWTKNRDITLRFLAQANLPERHLHQFYLTSGITTLPVAVGNKAAGTPVSGLDQAQGWDSHLYYSTNRMNQRGLAGHGTGHYLSGLSQAYTVTPSESQRATYLSRMKLMVQELGRIQDNNIATGSYMYGFLSAYNEKQFDALEEDKHRTPTTGETNGRGAWAVYYTQHKIIQGLLDVYTVLKDTPDDETSQRALEIASKMGDWTYLRLSRWTPAERDMMWNVYSAGEVGGIAQPIEQLYFITGDELYRETAAFFEHNNRWSGAGAGGVTDATGFTTQAGNTTAGNRSGDGLFMAMAKNDSAWINNVHANTQIPMVISALRQYEADTPLDAERINPVGAALSPDHYFTIAKNFWGMVYTSRLSPIGGTGNASNGEYFANLGNPVTPTWSTVLGTGSSANGANESCTTVNMMQLASSLFRHEPRAEYMDYYEKALLNHVMPALSQTSSATQNLIDYLTVLSTNATRSHSRYGAYGSCCSGTGLEAHTRYQEQVYSKTKDGRGLYVNLYLPTTLDWPEKGFQIVQKSDYLNEGKSRLTVHGSGLLDVYLRVPYWVEKGFKVKINGRVVCENAAKSSYVTLSRSWTPGDVIDITMPFSMRIERAPENTTASTATLFYGPYLMVRKTGASTRPAITGLNLSDLDASFTREPDTTNNHAFGSYLAFRFSHAGVYYDPFYTTGYTSANYCPSFTIARVGDDVTVTRGVPGGGGTVGANSNNRNLTNGQSVGRGSTITFTAVPDEGYKVKRWKLNGVTVGNNRSNVYTLTGIDKNANVTVEFVPLEGTLFSHSADELAPGATLRARTTVGVGTAMTGRVYLVVYGANERLLGVAMSDTFVFTGDSSEEKVVETCLTLPDDIEGLTLRAFVWDDSLAPLFPATALD